MSSIISDQHFRVSDIIQVQNAIRKLIGEKLINDGYCDLSEWDFSKYKVTNIRALFNECDIYAKRLFEKEALDKRKDIKKPELSSKEKEDEIVKLWVELFGDIEDIDEISAEEALAVIFWLNSFFTTKLSISADCAEIILEAVNKSKLFGLRKTKYKCLDNTLIIYNVKLIEPIIVGSLSTFMAKVFDLSKEKNGNELCYRGHSSVNYLLLPQIYRKNSKGEYSYYEKEDKIYNKIQVKCHDEFKECKTHLEKLVIMQHYEVPTRLMDVTINPLIAAYFACKDTSKKYGEVILFSIENEKIKWPGSDTVSILSSLAALSYEDKKNLTNTSDDEDIKESKAKLLGEIRNEKPAFIDQIQKGDCSKVIYINAPMNNKRIINQQGAFLIFGLKPINIIPVPKKKKKFHEKSIEPANDYRLMNSKNKRVVLLLKNKKTILEQLKTVGIDEEHLFPEITTIARSIAKEYYM